MSLATDGNNKLAIRRNAIDGFIRLSGKTTNSSPRSTLYNSIFDGAAALLNYWEGERTGNSLGRQIGE